MLGDELLRCLVSVDESTGFQWDVLYVIVGLDEPNGLAIKQQLEEYYETRVDRGQLYPNIDSLAEEGFIEKDRHEKRRNAHTVRSFQR